MAAPKVLTLVYLRRVRDGVSEVLLGYKKRGFGAGKWNGFGGKVDPEVDRSVYASAQREVLEECGVVVPDEGAAAEGGRPYRCTPLEQVGRNFYLYDTLPSKILDVRVYEAWVEETACADGHEYLVESDEMRPQWFRLDAVPVAAMWADDVHWLEQYLRHAPRGAAGEGPVLQPPFLGRYYFRGHEGAPSEDIYRLKVVPASPAHVVQGFLSCAYGDACLEGMLAEA
eukprot:TRINITY_DN21213_c0_g1_i1.p2 TRINITY_DN21213_c0_g1~~TRINITY_DN21213_c0_g1_i1.p2  ORF type:complete len:227 (+),score=93.00 TRINITY_DN21213_c0_g1_i1:34-714(+)